MICLSRIYTCREWLVVNSLVANTVVVNGSSQIRKNTQSKFKHLSFVGETPLVYTCISTRETWEILCSVGGSCEIFIS